MGKAARQFADVRAPHVLWDWNVRFHVLTSDSKFEVRTEIVTLPFNELTPGAKHSIVATLSARLAPQGDQLLSVNDGKWPKLMTYESKKKKKKKKRRL